MGQPASATLAKSAKSKLTYCCWLLYFVKPPQVNAILSTDDSASVNWLLFTGVHMSWSDRLSKLIGNENNNLKRKSEATVNRCLEAVATTFNKLDVLGVKLQVNEVKEVNFHDNS